jgi:hypothetical protein
MWRCPKCGETIEDQFDSCWKCTEAVPVERERPVRPPEPAEFFRCWWRGWLVLFLTVLVGFCVRFAVYVFSGAITYGDKLTREGRAWGGQVLPLLALALAVVALPVCAYLAFMMLFGEDAWPWKTKPGTPSREETASALFEEGARREARGNVRDALDAYAEIIESYPGTQAAQDARKSLESLRVK